MKYAEVWQSSGDPIYRPLWWMSPDDQVTFTVDDQFLIGDEVLFSNTDAVKKMINDQLHFEHLFTF